VITDILETAWESLQVDGVVLESVAPNFLEGLMFQESSQSLLETTVLVVPNIQDVVFVRIPAQISTTELL